MPKISEEGRKILKKWQGMGVKFMWRGEHRKYIYGLFSGPAEHYLIPAQPVPEQWDVKHLYKAINEGLKVNSGDGLCEVRIPAQLIPKEFLEMDEPKKEILIHHIPERKLWLAQREAGTNEQWQVNFEEGCGWHDVPVAEEPEWRSHYEYRPKPTTVKLYMAMLQYRKEPAHTFQASNISTIKEHARRHGITIIGNIEERDVEV